MLSFLSAPMGVAYHIVFALAHLLAPLGAGLATAAAIVVFTAAVRLLLCPLSYRAIRGQAAIAALQPKITALRTRYASQPDRLQRELASLYRAEGGGLLAGCLPLLLQLPFFSVMYRLFLSKSVDGTANLLLTRNLLGTQLGSHWLAGAGPLSGQGLLFFGLFALLAVVAYVTARVTRTASAAAGTATVASTATAASTTTGARPGGSPGQAAGLALISRIIPYSTLVIAAFVPLAAGIYLLTTTAWTAVERAVLRRWLPAAQPGRAQPVGAQPEEAQPEGAQLPAARGLAAHRWPARWRDR